ncbi:MAG: hypothetical protein WC799_18215 [Desulfobacteraceae bacterium]
MKKKRRILKYLKPLRITAIMKDFNWLKEETKLSKSNLLKSIILLINDDINNKKYPKNIEKLKDLSILI